MLEVFNENINFSNLFLSDMQMLFPPTKIDSISNDLMIESKEEVPSKQQIKFISTKQESPTVNLLQKKRIKQGDFSTDSDNSNNGRWTKEEQNRFAEAVLMYVNDWKKIQNHVSSRNITQVRSHAQKYLMKLKEKESNLLKDKGFEKNASWSKIMIFLRDNLTYDELKEVLFSVEQTEVKTNRNEEMKSNNNKQNMNKKSNKNKIEDKYNNNNIVEEINDNRSEHCINGYINLDFEEENYNIKNKIKENEEKEMLQKFIECFNSSYGEITLNSSFEENKDDINEEEHTILNEDPIIYNRLF